MTAGKGAHVIVVGNEKGGTGKSTTSMHLIVALLKLGRSVASIDLDLRQGTLTRYMDNRRAYAAAPGHGAPIAAVVVLSDGGFNQGASAEETARYARERRVPIYAIGIGDPSRPRNVRVVEAIAPENAFQDDPFSVSARLTAEGLDGETLIVQLFERGATGSGEGRIVDTRSVRVGSGGSIEPVNFERQGEGVGRHVYTIQVPVLESETVSEDNSQRSSDSSRSRPRRECCRTARRRWTRTRSESWRRV